EDAAGSHRRLARSRGAGRRDHHDRVGRRIYEAKPLRERTDASGGCTSAEEKREASGATISGEGSAVRRGDIAANRSFFETNVSAKEKSSNRLDYSNLSKHLECAALLLEDRKA